MSERDIAHAAERAAEIGAERAFSKQMRMLGIDMDNQESVNSFRDDIRYLRSIRTASEARKSQTLGTLRSSVIGAIVAAGAAWASGFLKIGTH